MTKGVPALPSGSRASHEAASSTASSPEASIPNAVAQIDYLVTALERVVDHKTLAPAKGRPPRILFESAVGCAEMELYAWRATYPDTAVAVEAYRDYWADGGAWEQDHAASAIEAPSGGETHASVSCTVANCFLCDAGGSTEGESAIGAPETPSPSPGPTAGR